MSEYKFINHTQGSFTVVNKNVFFDKTIDYAAIGLYCQLVSLPEEWSLSIRGLAQLHSNGVDSVKGLLKILIKKGYVSKSKQQKKAENGTFAGYEYHIWASPEENPYFIQEDARSNIKNSEIVERTVPLSTEQEISYTDEPCTKKPRVVKSAQYNTYILNIDDDKEETIDSALLDEKLEKCVEREIDAHLGEAEPVLELKETLIEVINAIKNPKVINAINKSSARKIGKLWSKTIELFDPYKDLNTNNNVANKEGYLRRTIENMYSHHKRE